MSEQRLDESQVPGGIYYRQVGKSNKYMAFNANGHLIQNAPPRAADTSRTEQPNAVVGMAPGGFDEGKLGAAIAQGLMQASKMADAEREKSLRDTNDVFVGSDAAREEKTATSGNISMADAPAANPQEAAIVQVGNDPATPSE